MNRSRVRPARADNDLICAFFSLQPKRQATSCWRLRWTFSRRPSVTTHISRKKTKNSGTEYCRKAWSAPVHSGTTKTRVRWAEFSYRLTDLGFDPANSASVHVDFDLLPHPYVWYATVCARNLRANIVAKAVCRFDIHQRIIPMSVLKNENR